jgi:hypothetical protein
LGQLLEFEWGKLPAVAGWKWATFINHGLGIEEYTADELMTMIVCSNSPSFSSFST